ncbi:MAG: UDP-N-acetylmuramoyl-L-alanyl-D-glutamate--2,6-diaminopimelate ligase [Acutalibacteraceae bacterium]|nr:UDP-N-acetylmuramoyl-L-alanyl-D-glutamate--2,6-diaminopimelate ligase [Oscillospiraceae bacterium]
MKLSYLLRNTAVKNEYKDVEISFITDDSRKCREGCAFVCIAGKNFDGHTAAAKAAESGAAAIIAERDTGCENQVLVDNTRSAYALMCSEFFSEPSKKIKLIGVTGTNGKTTVSTLIYDVLTMLGKKAGLIGTVSNIIDGKRTDSVLTTPDAFDLNRMFREMADCSTEYCVMEVSSQALDQCRTDGCHFDVGIFTNLTQDHLDYHGTMENYIAAKRKLFLNCDKAVVNMDDEAYKKLLEGTGCDVMTYSARQDTADLTAKTIKLHPDSVDYAVVGISMIGRVHYTTPGMFSVYNSMAVIGCMLKLGFDFEQVLEAVAKLRSVKGRFEVMDTDTPYKVIIDYAHTPDGLENVLKTLNEVKKGRVITVFGCGGDRDKTKRPIMGRTVAELSDIAVVTTDNPRTEDPESIINDILEGMKGSVHQTYVKVNRTQAIEFALSIAKENDIILLAGKGHETYQIIGREKTHYDEREKVTEYLRKQKEN